MNVIRKERGPDYKQRLSYTSQNLSNGNSYIPFSSGALFDISQNASWIGGSYIKTSTNKVTKDDMIKATNYYAH